LHSSFPIDIKEKTLRIAEMKLKSTQICPNQKYHKVACQIINSLLITKELEYMEYLLFFDNYKEADEILEQNAFAYHPRKCIVTFQSQSIELYIKINSDNFGVTLIDTLNIFLLLNSLHMKSNNSLYI